jgi:ABC-type sugar transport system, periplasmic component
MTNNHRLAVAVAAAALLVSACTGPVSDEASGELVVWTYFRTPGQQQALDQMADRFTKQFPDVKVVYESQPFEQMTPNLLAAAAAGRGPDVVIYQWGDILKLVEAKALSSMQPFFSTWPDADQFPDSVVHRVSGIEYDPNGETYTIQPYVNAIGLYYNQDILDKVGIEPPKTIDELEAALEAVTRAGFKGLVLDWRPGVGGWWGGMPWMWAHGVDLTMSPDKRGTIEQVLSRVRSWVQKGYVPADVVTFDQQTAMVQWLTGKFAFTVNGNWELTRVKDEATFDWGVVSMPSGPEDSSVYLGGEGLAIGAFSKDPDLAWKYLATTWLSREGQLSLVDTVGSIPVRADVADDPKIEQAQGLSAFLEQVPTGHRLPITQAENEAQTLFGDTWSAVVSGQLSPAKAADRLVSQTPSILGSPD